jgi:hypothetical protein
MPIQVDAYTTGGVASGVLTRAGHLRDILEQDREVTLERVRWRAIDREPVPAGTVTIPIDEILIATSDDDSTIPVHATWHAIRVELGPYVVEGDMPTQPGFDPGRALTRPSGEFVLLRDVRLGRRDPDADGSTPAPTVAIGNHALVNRYVVETVGADLMLGFFFPGAHMAQTDLAPTGSVETIA